MIDILMGERLAQWIISIATLSVAATFFAAVWHFLQYLSYMHDAWAMRIIGVLIIMIMAYVPYFFAFNIINRMHLPFFGYGAVITLGLCDIGVRFYILIHNHMYERGLMVFVGLSMFVLSGIFMMFIADRLLAYVSINSR